MNTLDLLAEIRGFQNQKFPNDEQTRSTNAESLYKQKKLFLRDIRQSFLALGYILLGIMYLRDNSLVLLVVKFNMHYRVSLCRGNGKETSTDEAMMIGQRTIATYLFSLAYHLIFGVLKTYTNDHLLHGSLTLQFIGESPASSRFELIFYDIITFAVIWIYFILMCQVEDPDIVQPVQKKVSSEENDQLRERLNGNGFTGNVFLMEIRPLEAMKAQQKAYVDYNMRQTSVFDQMGDVV